MTKNNFLRVTYGGTVHGKDEINAVKQVLNTSTQMGKNIFLFEDKIASLFDKKYGVMTNSGSSALYLAIESLQIPKNSEIITPALTFSTTVACLVKNDLIPVFVDVERDTFCINHNDIEKKITKKTKAILAPDLLGNICDWKEIRRLANKYNLIVIQDSADTLGAKLNKKNTGYYTDLSITSFYGSHIINGAGNGGILCTSNYQVCKKSKLLRSWGRSSSLYKDGENIKNRFNIKLDGITYDKKFVFEELGYNLEPSEISAAFGLVQLKKLQKHISLRRSFFKQHLNFFKKYSNLFTLPKENIKSITGWLAFPLIVKNNKFFNRTDLQVFLEKRNIQTRVILTGNILRQPAFKNIKCKGKANEFINSDNVMRNGILIGCHHGLNNKLIKHIHKSIEFFLSKLKYRN